MKLHKKFLAGLLAIAVALLCAFALPQTAHTASVYIPGDLDGDNSVSQNDVVYLLLHNMFGETAYPLNGADADIDGNGAANQDDVVYLLLHTMFGETAYPLKHNYVASVTLAPTCTTSGIRTYTCTWCSRTYTETIPANGTHEFVTKRMSDAAKTYIEQGDYYYASYVNFKDWDVDVCKHCDYIDIETLRFAYSDYEAAEIMLGYVNDLRESVYGTDEYNLVLDDTLMELAKIRAKELAVYYGHGGTYTNAGENIVARGDNIYMQYQDWYNSSGHYKIMTTKRYQYFGYAIYKPSDVYSTVVYGVQLFWDENDKFLYNYWLMPTEQ